VVVIRRIDGRAEYFDDGSDASVFLWGLDARDYSIYVLVDPTPIEVGAWGERIDKALSTVKEQANAKSDEAIAGDEPSPDVEIGGG
jgi:hypothetical protein